MCGAESVPIAGIPVSSTSDVHTGENEAVLVTAQVLRSNRADTAS
jgi:hypothetical protein